MTTDSTGWRIAFTVMTADQQRECVRDLRRLGWIEEQLLELTQWRADYLLSVLAVQTPQTVRRNTP